MSITHANPSLAVTVDIDYWSLEPRIRDIQWSNEHNAHLAHLFDERTGLKGSMKVCLGCVTMHVYYGCDGKVMDHGFEPCDTNRPIYHPSYLEIHYNLEPNNRYVQLAILRTHRRKLVPTGRHAILQFRGYDPPTKPHSRHVPKCFRGSSPQYIIQGSGALGTSVYYRRCDGRFRNLAHQVLKMEDEDTDDDNGVASSVTLPVQSSDNASKTSATRSGISRGLTVAVPRK